MSFATELRKVVRSARASLGSDPIERIERTGTFTAADIPLVQASYFSPVGPVDGGPWDPFRHAHLELPSWFRHGLDPYSAEYAAQQRRLWALVAGVERDYDVEVDEKEADWGSVDAVRFPGYFARRDPGAVAAASDHVIASGMIMKHCGLKPGDWALEYGAGFGQTALALARLGVNVDTVDVSDQFCRWVGEQAEFFRVPLTPFKGRFGDAPRSSQRYDVVWFYESFHHCLDFVRVVGQLPKLLRPGGRVILAGEPIVERENAAVPYPWGLRLHSEVVAVVRRQRWFELGFSEDFLFELFAHAGFTMQRIECEPSLFGRAYICQHRENAAPMGKRWLPPRIRETLGTHRSGGAALVSSTRLPIERIAAPRTLSLGIKNVGRSPSRVRCNAGDAFAEAEVGAGSCATIDLEVPAGCGDVVVEPVGQWTLWRRQAKSFEEVANGLVIDSLVDHHWRAFAESRDASAPVGRLRVLDCPDVLRAESEAIVSVAIEIPDSLDLPADSTSPISAAYHWFDLDGRTVVFEGLRTPLPDGAFAAGGVVHVSARVVAPATPGRLALCMTLVHEGVCWFEQIGWIPGLVQVEILP